MAFDPEQLELTDNGYLPYGVDVDEIIAEGWERELVAVWCTYHYNGEGPALPGSVSNSSGPDLGDDVVSVDEFRRRRIARESKYAPVTSLQALAANAHLVDLLLEFRWRVMGEAREYDGKSWAEIGTSLGMTEREAAEWYQKMVTEDKKRKEKQASAAQDD
ncbi:hypothetical protein [Nocardia gipuzkoensis]